MTDNQTKKSHPLRTPTLHKEFVLKSQCAQGVWRKSQEHFNRGFSQIQTSLALMCTEEEYDRLENALDGIIKTAEESVDSALQANRHVKAKPNFPRITYSEPLTVKVDYSSPAMLRFINTVLKLDELACIIDAMWLQGGYSSLDRRRMIYAWQNYFKAMYMSCRRLINGGWDIVKARRASKEPPAPPPQGDLFKGGEAASSDAD